MTNDRFDPSRIAQAFDAKARQYDAFAGLQQDVGQACLALAVEAFPQQATILDIGAGTGKFARSSQSERPEWNITGLDLSPGMCVVAKEHGVSMITASAEALPFDDHMFDGIYSSLMLQWINRPEQVFREMLRVMKPGARAVVSTFAYGTLRELQEAFATLDMTPRINQFGPPNYFSALAVHTGFSMLTIEEDVYTEYYPDVLSILRAIKAIGAATKEQGHLGSNVITRKQLAKLEAFYREHYQEEDGLPVSWEVLTLTMEKPL